MKSRLLEPSEWSRVMAAPLVHLVPKEDVRVVAVENGVGIVASMAVLKLLHFEGAWIDPAYRNAGVVRALMRGAREASGPAPWAIAGAADENMREILGRLGGVKMEMDSYVLNLGGS